MSLLNQHGLYQKMMKDAPSEIIGTVYGEIPEWKKNKISNKLPLKSSFVVSIGWRHFRDVMLVPGVGALVGLIAVLVETQIFSYNERRREESKYNWRRQR